MTKKPAMAPEIKGFFDKALPKGSGGHVLALGEDHRQSDHIHYLNARLPELITEHRLGTLGIEDKTFMNVLFWAYQDGTLEKKCGSKEAARRYFTQLSLSIANENFVETAAQHAALCMDAMDRGISVVAFDSRATSKDLFSLFEGAVKGVHESWSQKRKNDGSPFKEIERDYLKEGMQTHAIHALPKIHLVLEIQALLKGSRDYRTRLAHMEDLVDIGRKKNIGSDALSATLLAAVTKPEKNTLTITGYAHTNTAGIRGSGKQGLVHGTFPHHIGWAQPKYPEGGPLKVTCAVLAGVGWADDIKADYAVQKPYASDNLDAPSWEYLEHVANTERNNAQLMASEATNENFLDDFLEKYEDAYLRSDITYRRSRNAVADQLVNMDAGTVEDLPQPGIEAAAPIEARFREPFAIDNTEIVARRMNPLLIPEIQKAYDAVRADWNPQLETQRGGR